MSQACCFQWIKIEPGNAIIAAGVACIILSAIFSDLMSRRNGIDVQYISSDISSAGNIQEQKESRCISRVDIVLINSRMVMDRIGSRLESIDRYLRKS